MYCPYSQLHYFLCELGPQIFTQSASQPAGHFPRQELCTWPCAKCWGNWVRKTNSPGHKACRHHKFQSHTCNWLRDILFDVSAKSFQLLCLFLLSPSFFFPNWITLYITEEFTIQFLFIFPFPKLKHTLWFVPSLQPFIYKFLFILPSKYLPSPTLRFHSPNYTSDLIMCSEIWTVSGVIRVNCSDNPPQNISYTDIKMMFSTIFFWLYYSF